MGAVERTLASVSNVGYIYIYRVFSLKVDR